MDRTESFSDRHGLAPTDVEITVRNDAPEELRGVLLEIAEESGLRPSILRSIACRVLRRRANPANWSEYPNIWQEVELLLDECEWYRVYDIVEAIHEEIAERDETSAGDPFGPEGTSNAEEFRQKMNDYFRRRGIGWQLTGEGRVEARGSEPFEAVRKEAQKTLHATGRSTASNELRLAMQDLSRRPTPDLTGAIQHSIASLECVARDVSGSSKTLGAILKDHCGLVPPPLDKCVEKAWGYASQRGRHLLEGEPPEFEEAELIVGIAASVANYLAKKSSDKM